MSFPSASPTCQSLDGLDLPFREGVAEASRPIRILYVEDNVEHAELMLLHFSAAESDFEVVWRPTLLEAMEALVNEWIDVVLLDLGMPELSGPLSFKAIRVRSPNVPVVVLTGNTSDRVRRNLREEGVKYYLEKPGVTPDQICHCVRAAVDGR